jgi:hypothetical protein
MKEATGNGSQRAIGRVLGGAATALLFAAAIIHPEVANAADDGGEVGGSHDSGRVSRQRVPLCFSAFPWRVRDRRDLCAVLVGGTIIPTHVTGITTTIPTMDTTATIPAPVITATMPATIPARAIMVTIRLWLRLAAQGPGDLVLLLQPQRLLSVCDTMQDRVGTGSGELPHR